MAFAVNFLVRRLGQGIIIIFLVAFLVFTLLRVVPGDPVRIILGPMTPPSVLEETAKALGLRDPIPVQFARYLGELAQGDFGHSFIRGKQGGSTGGSRGEATRTTQNRAAVLGLIAKTIPYSLMLAATAMVLALLFSVPLGIAAGLRAGAWPDKLALYISSTFVSLPNIWLGVVFILIFSAKAGWLPAIGYKGFSYTILPALVLAIELSPVMIRSISVSVATNMQEGYVEMGMLRGLPRWKVITKHVLRNASIPLLNLFGAQTIGMLLGGLFVVEFIFSYPGLGLLTINAVFERDFPVIQAVAIMASAALVIINMTVDFVATNIDRRLQF